MKTKHKELHGGIAETRTGETRDEAARHSPRSVEDVGAPGARSRKQKTHDEDLGPDQDEGEGDDRLERLNKALARAGVASRRHVDEMIRAGKIGLNGQVVTELGTKVDPWADRVTLNNHRVALIPPEQHVKFYYLLNKPLGVLSTASDDRGRKTVLDLVKGATDARIYPVGRLDYDAEGALLLTNDGDLAAALMAPKKSIPKVYQVKVKGEPTEDRLDILRHGIRLEDGPTKPCEIRKIKKARVNTWVEVILTEGKNRQLKRMFWRIRHPVQKILRVSFAGLELKDLRAGEYRELTKAEVDRLRRAVG